MNSKTKENSSSTTNSTGTVNPTDVQAGYLNQAFGGATEAYNQASGNQYSGEQLAQFNPAQLANFQKMLGFADSNTQPQQSAAVGAALTGAGVGGTQSALNTLTNYTPQGGTGTNISAAGRYADNPYISGQVQAAMRDATRSVSEQALPQVARSAAIGGNALGSKRAISEGILQRGLAEKTADVSANLRGNAWDQGLQLAESGRQFDNTANINAARYAGDISADASKTGLVAGDASIAQQKDLFEIANAGGVGQQAATQADLDNQKLMMEYANAGDWNNVAKLYAIVGDKMWGNQTTGTEQKTGTKTTETDPGLMAKIGGGIGAVGSLFGMPTGGVSLGGRLFG